VLDGRAELRLAEERRLLAVVRLAVNGSREDIEMWEQMQGRRAGRNRCAGADSDEDEAEFQATLRALGLRLEEDDGQ